MPWLPSLLVVGLFSAQVAATAAPGVEWKATGSKNGVELFKREVEGSDIIQLRGKGKIPAPLWRIAATLLDTKRAPEWVDSLKRSTVVKHIDSHTYIEYNHIGTPFVMRDRDFVSRVKIESDPKAETFALIYAPYEETDTEGVPATDHIRGLILSGVFHLSALGPEETLLDAEVHCDPRGSVAKWIVNFFQSTWAYDTFLALKTQVAKSDIRIVDEFKHLLLPTQAFLGTSSAE